MSLRSEDSGDEMDPTLTSLSDIYRRPTTAPLATVAATVVLAVGTYQTYHVATTRTWWLGLLVAVAFSVSYLLAKRGWQIQNAVVDRRFARMEPESTPDDRRK